MAIFGLGQQKPHHFLEMAKIAWENRDELPFAWRILNDGVCDGCALGTSGLRDWTLSGPHLCMVRLELIGHDHPGIVRDISRALARHGANIEELETDVTSAPMSGDMLFTARVTVGVPANVTVDQLRAVLEELAGELMVDLALDDTASDQSPTR